MSDANTAARGARESLARGLNALQSDPNVPPALMELAAPIAQAMGALHQIESTGQLVPHAENALNFVRTALQGLQSQPPTVAAVSQAMEAVAGSLGMVHSLTRMAQGGQPAAAAPPPVPPRPAAPQAPVFPGAQHAPPSVPRPAAPQAPQANAYAPTQQAAAVNVPPPPAFIQQQQPPPPQYVQQAAPPPPQPQYVPQQAPPQYVQQQAAPQYVQQQAAPPPPQYVPQQAPPPAYQQQQPPTQGPNSRAAPPAPPLPGDSPTINADLGTHSATNFYKGLSGNDIIDHGGLFVSTYMVPKIGASVRLKVSMPGGYEFEANAVVAWSREQSDGGADAPPGFGARFTQITTEARQLVYRYVRNREPLFHDDL